MDCDELETMLSGDLHRGLDVINHHQGHSVGSMDYEKSL
jgi:hypothetical protein